MTLVDESWKIYVKFINSNRHDLLYQFQVFQKDNVSSEQPFFRNPSISDFCDESKGNILGLKFLRGSPGYNEGLVSITGLE